MLFLKESLIFAVCLASLFASNSSFGAFPVWKYTDPQVDGQQSFKLLQSYRTRREAQDAGCQRKEKRLNLAETLCVCVSQSVH